VRGIGWHGGAQQRLNKWRHDVLAWRGVQKRARVNSASVMRALRLASAAACGGGEK
jgi:hypothetical protein